MFAATKILYYSDECGRLIKLLYDSMNERVNRLIRSGGREV
jgi:hypothetical protein